MSTFPYTVQDFEEASKRTGLELIERHYVKGHDGKPTCACPLMVLVADKHGVEAMIACNNQIAEGWNQRKFWLAGPILGEKLNLDDDQSNAFMLGFDGGEVMGGVDHMPEKPRDAFSMGRELRAKVYPGRA